MDLIALLTMIVEIENEGVTNSQRERIEVGIEVIPK